MYIKVALENTTYSYDKLYTYKAELNTELLPGMRVNVPFGHSNKSRIALIIDIADSVDIETKNIKNLTAVLDKEPIISGELISLIKWIKQRYLCTYTDAVHCVIPPAMMYKVNYRYSLVSRNISSSELSEQQEQLLAFLNNSDIDSQQLKKMFGIDDENQQLLDLYKRQLINRTELFTRKVNDASVKMISAVSDYSGTLTSRQSEVYEILSEFGALSVKELSYFTGASSGVFNSLVNKGAASYFKAEVYRKPQIKAERSAVNRDIQLNEDQQSAYEGLLNLYNNREFKTALLYGVTGSGKTSVFVKLIENVINTGREVIVLVPEISLTSQTVQSLRNAFGEDNVAVIHSSLSGGERYDEWKRCRDGNVKILVGTRSAIFAPFKNLGLVVIDEEHEHTYKSEMSPRYDAKEVAAYRCKYNNALLLLSSATPSISSAIKAENKTYDIFTLKSRFGTANLPKVQLVDMINETLEGNTGELALVTKKSLIDNYKNGKQSIVLINRRGYHTYVRCTSCRTVVCCPNCSISMTYHFDNNRLMCHYCGYSVPFSPVCPNCGEESVSARGLGTQKTEMLLQDLIPGAKILRIDTDSVARKYSLDKKLDDFAAGHYDIMVGTQMVSKGLNFDNVTLVCVLNIDQLLYNDDYKANERTFELLTQVVGRAGRGIYPGKAIIQTEIPGNTYINCAAEQNYRKFYRIEKSYRRMMLYPPYCDILLCGFISENESSVKASADYFLSVFTEKAKLDEFSGLPIRAFVPTQANIYKIGNKYRYKLIIKCKNSLSLRKLIQLTLQDYYSNTSNKNVSVFVDINPESNF